ncbi:major capsid protein [Pararhodospirillum photometricum]|nr:major capsid protein [Pararhodospirillum photometricum]
MPELVLDIFNEDAFSLSQLILGLEKVPYLPTTLGDMGLFEAVYLVGTDQAVIERQDSVLSLVQTSERGAPVQRADAPSSRRDIRSFSCPRLHETDEVTAAELFRMRAMGVAAGSQTLEAEVQTRLLRRRRNIEYTWENMRLGALQGVVLDKDASVIRDWYQEWAIAKPAEINFALGTEATDVRKKCSDVRRAMIRAAKGAFVANTTVHALAGDGFYDALINHPQVRRTYEGWSAAADLRGGAAFESFSYAGITFHNYRGSDDATSVAVASEKAHFFPMGAVEVFKVVFAPGEKFAHLGQQAVPLYPVVKRDEDDEKLSLDLRSYPLFMCLKPEVLQRAKAG